MNDLIETFRAPAVSRPEMRARVMKLEEALLKLPQADMPTMHLFAPGMYVRPILIPAGVALTGKIHVTEHFCFLMQGDIELLTEEGVHHVTAPAILRSKPGAKRAGYAHTESIFVTVHATNETDLEKLEAELTAETFDDPRLPPTFPALENSL